MEGTAPRAPADLLDLLVPLGLGRQSVVLDPGWFDGAWSRRIQDRLGCRVTAVDQP